MVIIFSFNRRGALSQLYGIAEIKIRRRRCWESSDAVLAMNKNKNASPSSSKTIPITFAHNFNIWSRAKPNDCAAERGAKFDFDVSTLAHVFVATNMCNYWPRNVDCSVFSIRSSRLYWFGQNLASIEYNYVVLNELQRCSNTWCDGLKIHGLVRNEDVTNVARTKDGNELIISTNALEHL